MPAVFMPKIDRCYLNINSLPNYTNALELKITGFKALLLYASDVELIMDMSLNALECLLSCKKVPDAYWLQTGGAGVE